MSPRGRSRRRKASAAPRARLPCARRGRGSLYVRSVDRRRPRGAWRFRASTTPALCGTGRQSVPCTEQGMNHVESDERKAIEESRSDVPVLPLRDVVVFPHLVIPLFVGREKSIVALDHAMQAGRDILLIAQREAEVDSPTERDLYRIGTLASILQLVKL